MGTWVHAPNGLSVGLIFPCTEIVLEGLEVNIMCCLQIYYSNRARHEEALFTLSMGLYYEFWSIPKFSTVILVQNDFTEIASIEMFKPVL